jgi:hypothetical protein
MIRRLLDVSTGILLAAAAFYLGQSALDLVLPRQGRVLRRLRRAGVARRQEPRAARALAAT